jgi:hypothetical protein
MFWLSSTLWVADLLQLDHLATADRMVQKMDQGSRPAANQRQGLVGAGWQIQQKELQREVQCLSIGPRKDCATH